ncbi:MAG: hypothetical protein RLZZ419_1512 [Pseudomonadota bacterium]|jgi:prophage regulatory protein
MLEQEQVIRMKKLLVETGLSRSTVYAKITPASKYFDKNFPQPFKLSSRSIGFKRSQLNTWLENLSSTQAA